MFNTTQRTAGMTCQCRGSSCETAVLLLLFKILSTLTSHYAMSAWIKLLNCSFWLIVACTMLVFWCACTGGKQFAFFVFRFCHSGCLLLLIVFWEPRPLTCPLINLPDVGLFSPSLQTVNIRPHLIASRLFGLYGIQNTSYSKFINDFIHEIICV